MVRSTRSLRTNRIINDDKVLEPKKARDSRYNVLCVIVVSVECASLYYGRGGGGGGDISGSIPVSLDFLSSSLRL